jgi:hypothetical protein
MLVDGLGNKPIAARSEPRPHPSQRTGCRNLLVKRTRLGSISFYLDLNHQCVGVTDDIQIMRAGQPGNGP